MDAGSRRCWWDASSGDRGGVACWPPRAWKASATAGAAEVRGRGGCAVNRLVVAASLLLLASGHVAAAQTPGRQEARDTEAPTAPPPGATTATWVFRDRRYGFSLTYPAEFVLDRATLPPEGGAAEFWTADGRAGFTAYGTENPSGRRSLQDLFAEARGNIAAQEGGRVTYSRVGEDWFVVSGVAGGRIIYQRSVLGRAGRVIATLYISYPEAEKARWDAAVTLMSRSFGFGGRAGR